MRFFNYTSNISHSIGGGLNGEDGTTGVFKYKITYFNYY
ncbi:hypothetical protein EZS27_003013 [termite gut metagenome]|uniref:Uncharacterized protein n=1 Tax=termite gut metagenome TaxID=433724 RepID=A0A5J4SUI4_9ZZZZ